MSKIDDVIIDAHNAAPMGYGIWATEIKSWLMESKDHIASSLVAAHTFIKDLTTTVVYISR